MKSMKAQIWSTDFIISAVIFFMALIIVIFSWNFVTQNTQQQIAINNIESGVLDITDILVRSPGLPEDWTPGNVQSIGLASEENRLDETKINNFLLLNYIKAKRLLGIKNYEFYFEMCDLDGDVVKNQAEQNITKGIYPEDSIITIPLERYALYNEDIVKLKFIFWSKYI